jgi:hypothetical protein
VGPLFKSVFSRVLPAERKPRAPKQLPSAVLPECSATRFPLGQVRIAPEAEDVLSPDEVRRALSRHAMTDWGRVPDGIAAMNDQALQTGGRLGSAYRSESRVGFWVITEADRATTTVYLEEW